MQARIMIEKEGELKSEKLYFNPNKVEAFYLFAHETDPYITIVINGMDYTIEYDKKIYDQLVKIVLDD